VVDACVVIPSAAAVACSDPNETADETNKTDAATIANARFRRRGFKIVTAP
jgi:hypothetical protein